MNLFKLQARELADHTLLSCESAGIRFGAGVREALARDIDHCQQLGGSAHDVYGVCLQVLSRFRVAKCNPRWDGSIA